MKLDMRNPAISIFFSLGFVQNAEPFGKFSAFIHTTVWGDFGEVKPLQHFEIFLYAFYFVFTYFSPRLSLRSTL